MCFICLVDKKKKDLSDFDFIVIPSIILTNKDLYPLSLQCSHISSIYKIQYYLYTFILFSLISVDEFSCRENNVYYYFIVSVHVCESKRTYV